MDGWTDGWMDGIPVDWVTRLGSHASLRPPLSEGVHVRHKYIGDEAHSELEPSSPFHYVLQSRFGDTLHVELECFVPKTRLQKEV